MSAYLCRIGDNMNKKIKLSLFVFIIIGVVILNFTYKNKNEETKTKKRKQNNLAIMVKGESGNYESSDAIPKGNYILNKDKTVCENNGKVLNYDSATGKVSFSFVGSDRCSLYFDKIIDTEKPVISNLTVNDTTITATLTDNMELSGYGISTSNSVEPTSWTSISGTSYNLSTTITTEGTYYLWVKDSSDNKTVKKFTISLGTSFEALMVANNTDIFEENGIRYEGADPDNYICLDNQKEGSCSNGSLLFRIIGLFNEDTSSDGTTSSGTKELLKVIDTNNYGGTSGEYWSGSSSKRSNNWSKSTLNTELNETYLSTLLATSGVNSKLSSAIANTKWHLGGASSSNYITLAAEGIYKEEINTSAIYGGNPSSIYAKVGLMYPRDYGYATVGGTTTNKSSCRAKELYNWDGSSYSDCKNNDWLFISQSSFVNSGEWLLSPCSSNSFRAAILGSSGYVDLSGSSGVDSGLFAVRPTFYLDSSVLKIVGTGDGSSTNPYRIG